MIKAKDFLDYLKLKIFFCFTGVPCAILREILRQIELDSEMSYIPAVRENMALGLASGAYLVGRNIGILMQNSGFANIVNTLTSFNLIYKIPVLMFITWRGFEGKDAPEHLIMGEKMNSLLDILSIPYRVLTDFYKDDIDWAIDTMKKEQIPVALIIKKGSIG